MHAVPIATGMHCAAYDSEGIGCDEGADRAPLPSSFSRVGAEPHEPHAWQLDTAGCEDGIVVMPCMGVGAYEADIIWGAPSLMCSMHVQMTLVS